MALFGDRARRYEIEKLKEESLSKTGEKLGRTGGGRAYIGNSAKARPYNIKNINALMTKEKLIVAGRLPSTSVKCLDEIAENNKRNRYRAATAWSEREETVQLLTTAERPAL